MYFILILKYCKFCAILKIILYTFIFLSNIKNIAAQPKPQTAQVPSENAPRLQHRKGGQYKKKKKGK